jgi:hypothetical protein
MSASIGAWRRRPQGKGRRLSALIPETQADWIERIAEREGRPTSEVVRLLVQQGLRIYRLGSGSVLCEWPDCNRRTCCAPGISHSGVSEDPGRDVLPFRIISRTPRDEPPAGA